MRHAARTESLVSIRRRRATTSSLAEVVLRIAGVDQLIIDELRGDLTEEYHFRVTRDGETRARCWRLYESLRSAPYLGLSALRSKARHHPAQLTAVVGGAALAASLCIAVRVNAKGPPALLTPQHNGAFIVNSVRPVKLWMRVADAAGHQLPSVSVRYKWTSGVPVSVSPAGVVTCSQPGDATVRATLDALEASISLLCRPVRDVRATALMDLVVGGDAQDLRFEATDASGRTVDQLAGEIIVGDSTIATLEGQRIRARAPGSTWVILRLGDHESFTSVHTYQRVAQLERILPGQRLAIDVRLEPRETRQWTLPAGHYFLAIHPLQTKRTRPRLAVVGATCKSELDHFACWVRDPATVIAYFPRNANQDQPTSGQLTIWRQEEP
jgi:hypothetical protein